jgi:5-methylcytosine-specific restriction enzyme subunit McrC
MIKVQNIYHMLAYAFLVLKEDSYSKIAAEDFDLAENLLAAILAKGIANQVKRGLGREYVHCLETLSSPRGKIDISKSLKERAIHKRRLVCEFDEFVENAYVNQILKTTALLLIRSADIQQEQKKALKRVMMYFHNVDEINPKRLKWSSIKYHSNNATYKMLINICYLVVEALLPTTQKGTRKISRFRDEHLHSLFERFVIAYYRMHHSEYNVSSPRIDWTVDDGDSDMLPKMKLDIMLKSDKEDKSLIIDTKYYSRILQSGYLTDARSIRSNHLYQIYAYVKNVDAQNTGKVSGMLLYAKTDEGILPEYKNYLMDKNRISVRTLDLNKDFEDIRSQLDAIVEEWSN